MSDQEGIDLACCTEYHQALGARVPRLAHGTILVLAALLGSALLWAGLTRADLEVRQARARQAQDVRLTQVELDSARDEHQRVRRLTLSSSASATDLVKARARLLEAEARVDKARLPVEEARLEVLRRGLVVLEKD